MKRCHWVEDKPDFYKAYHDHIWGKPLHDDRLLFKWLLLETFHVGLSWQVVLAKEAAFARAFDDFDFNKIAHYSPSKIDSLINDPSIIRHAGKIRASRENAQALLKVREIYGSFDHFIWSFTQGHPIDKRYPAGQGVNSSTLSDQITRSMKKIGFKYIGTVTIYAYLQAIGVINGHDCECDFG